MESGVEFDHAGGLGSDGEGEVVFSGGEDGGDQGVYVAGLGFYHEDYGVVAEVCVWAVQHADYDDTRRRVSRCK